MAGILNSAGRTQTEPPPKAGETHGYPQPVHLSALTLKPIQAATINGHNLFYDQLDRLEQLHEFLGVAGYIPKTVAEGLNVQEIMKYTDQALKKVNRKFQQAYVMDGKPDRLPANYNEQIDGDEFWVNVNWIKIDDGYWTHAVSETLGHPAEVQKVLMSGLCLLNKMGFGTCTDTPDYEMFSDSEEYLNCNFEEAAERDNKEVQGYLKEVAFYKTNPMKFKYNARLVHEYAKHPTAIGDWLRVLLHYRHFDWYSLIPSELIDDSDTEMITIGQSRMIIYDYDHLLTHIISESLDMQWQNGGDIGLADYALYSRKRQLNKYKNLPHKQLATDFNKMWRFNMEELEYLDWPLNKKTNTRYKKILKYVPSPADYRTRCFSPNSYLNGVSNKTVNRQRSTVNRKDVRGNSSRGSRKAA